MLTRGFIFLFVLACVFLASCGGDKYGDPDNPYQACFEGQEKSFEDQEGDIDKKFIDLTKLKIIIGSDCVGAHIEVSDLPQTLTFNHSELKDGEINYEWSVYFDISGDDNLSEGDLALSITHQKPWGSEEREYNVLSFTQYSLWERAHDNKMKFIDYIYASVAGNIFKLGVSKSVFSKLFQISASTKVKFVAAYDDGINKYRDVYPDSDLFE